MEAVLEQRRVKIRSSETLTHSKKTYTNEVDKSELRVWNMDLQKIHNEFLNA